MESKLKPLLAVEEYLSTSYHPDQEYVHGELVERRVGTYTHSRLQALLTMFFGTLEDALSIRVITEQRIRVLNTVGDKRYRIPDVCVVRTPFEHEEVFTRPPYLVIEILSADDRVADTLLKTSDYSRFGIQHIWIVDPETEKLFSADSQGIREIEDLVGQLPEINLSVDFNLLFGKLRQA